MTKKSTPEFEIKKDECPKCSFSGNEKFPNGYAIEGNTSSKHCPSCGYWSNQE